MRKPFCPCCKQERSLEDTPLEKLEGYSGFLSWACRFCIESGRAIKARLKVQKCGLNGGHQAYYDHSSDCQSCGENFVFRATEQRYWYEELGFHAEAYPLDCLACRKSKQREKEAHHGLSLLLNQDSKMTADDLERASKLYEDLGLKEKAELFRRRAKNLREP